MAEILASLADINAHLPVNVQIDNSVDDGLQVDASRLIRGQLVSIFSIDVLNTWDSPDNTPEYIRSIAGKLIASKYYARLVAGNVPDEMADYAVDLYKQAISDLIDIKSGEVVLIGSDGSPITPSDIIGSDPDADVFPNDDSPVFTMGRVFS